jgi:hypothetical protein
MREMKRTTRRRRGMVSRIRTISRIHVPGLTIQEGRGEALGLRLRFDRIDEV